MALPCPPLSPQVLGTTQPVISVASSNLPLVCFPERLEVRRPRPTGVWVTCPDARCSPCPTSLGLWGQRVPGPVPRDALTLPWAPGSQPCLVGRSHSPGPTSSPQVSLQLGILHSSLRPSRPGQPGITQAQPGSGPGTCRESKFWTWSPQSSATGDGSHWGRAWPLPHGGGREVSLKRPLLLVQAAGGGLHPGGRLEPH